LEEKKNEVKEELKKLRETKPKWSDQNWKGNFTDYNWWYHL